VRQQQQSEVLLDTIPGQMARNELDTRADTICAGANFKCIRLTGMVCQVQGFHKSFDAIPNIPVATVATVWDDPNTGNIGIELDDIFIPFQMEVAEHAIANKIHDKPAFAWWVPVVI
jgi:hypothetical protein